MNKSMKHVDLKSLSTLLPKGMIKSEVNSKILLFHEKLFGLQNILFEETKHPILIILLYKRLYLKKPLKNGTTSLIALKNNNNLVELSS